MARISKRNRFDVEHIPPVMFISEALPGEQFHIIEPRVAHNVLPYYAISTYGRVWHIFERRFMRTSYDGPGYRIAVLRTTEGAKTFRVHRIMMLTFNYFDGCESYVCNHIDGVKTHNWIGFPNKDGGGTIDNLEWVTYKENRQHAIDNGLLHGTEPPKHVAPQMCNSYFDYVNGRSRDTVKRADVVKKKINHEDAKQICMLLSTGQYNTREVAQLLNVSPAIVSNILHGLSWTDVSKDYTMRAAYHPSEEI